MGRTASLTLALFLLSAGTAWADPYVVRRGDTLSELALRFHTSVTALKRANGLHNSLIRIGQVLEIPGSSAAPQTQTSPANDGGSERTYTVRWGDSLSRIGDQFGVPWQQIKSANGLRSTVIQPGQVLVIPGQDPAPETTETTTAETTETTTEATAVDAGLPLDFAAGTLTHAPDVDATPPLVSSTSQTPPELTSAPVPLPVVDPRKDLDKPLSEEPTFHVVRSGDTLGVLATKYRTTVTAIKALNGLTSDLILVGQRLKIPGLEPVDPEIYYVEHEPMPASEAEVKILARLIRSEVPAVAPYEGAVAVGAVVLNRVRSPHFPNTIAKVIGQRGRTKSGRIVYQFSGYNDSNYRQNPIPDYALRAARAALSGIDPVSGADHYYNPFLVAPSWGKRLSFVRRIGDTRRTAHDFYRRADSGFAEIVAASGE